MIFSSQYWHWDNELPSIVTSAALFKSFSEDISRPWSPSSGRVPWTDLPELHTELEVRLHQHKEGQSFLLPSWQCCAEGTPEHSYLPGWQGTAGSYSTCHQSKLPLVFPWGCFPGSCLPTCTYSLDYPITGRKSTTCCYSVSCSWWLPTSLVLSISL